MAFPSTNITLKQVCDAYGVASNMAALRGNQFLDSSNNLQIALDRDYNLSSVFKALDNESSVDFLFLNSLFLIFFL